MASPAHCLSPYFPLFTNEKVYGAAIAIVSTNMLVQEKVIIIFKQFDFLE
jgi:hypothetical protein